MSDCPFCAPDPSRVFHETELVLALWDAFPVSPGHALLVPRRHVASFFDATPDERAALFAALDDVRAAIERTHAPDGYNIGVNVGEAGRGGDRVDLRIERHGDARAWERVVAAFDALWENSKRPTLSSDEREVGSL